MTTVLHKPPVAIDEQFAQKNDRDRWIENCSGMYRMISYRGTLGGGTQVYTSSTPMYVKVVKEKDSVTSGDMKRIILEYLRNVKHLDGSVRYGIPAKSGIGITNGADPEMFVVDEKGRVVPFGDVLGMVEKGYGVIQDGFAAEFTPQANTCLAYFTDNLQGALAAGWRGIQRYNKASGKKCKYSVKDYYPIPLSKRLKALPSTVELGCKPSKNAYGDTVRFRNGIDVPYRTAGCHMHFSVSPASARYICREYVKKIDSKFQDTGNDAYDWFGLDNEEWVNGIVQWIDAVAGVWSVGVLPMQDPRRRKLYGRAGEYRLTKYSGGQRGLEYRVHSSYVLCHPGIWHLMYEITRGAAYMGLAGMHVYLRDMFPEPGEVKRIINNVDVIAARKVINKPELKTIFDAILDGIGDGNTRDPAYSLANKGVQCWVDLEDVENNWLLDGDKYNWTEHSASKNCCWASMARNIVGPNKEGTRKGTGTGTTQ